MRPSSSSRATTRIVPPWRAPSPGSLERPGPEAGSASPSGTSSLSPRRPRISSSLRGSGPSPPPPRGGSPGTVTSHLSAVRGSLLRSPRSNFRSPGRGRRLGADIRGRVLPVRSSAESGLQTLADAPPQAARTLRSGPAVGTATSGVGQHLPQHLVHQPAQLRGVPIEKEHRPLGDEILQLLFQVSQVGGSRDRSAAAGAPGLPARTLACFRRRRPDLHQRDPPLALSG